MCALKICDKEKVCEAMKRVGKNCKSVLFGFFCMIMVMISILGIIISNLATWVLDTWGLLSIDEIIFHLKVPLEGTNSEVVQDGVNACLPLAILALLLIIAFLAAMRKHKGISAVVMLAVSCISFGSACKAAYKVYSDLDVKTFLESQGSESEFIQEHYVDPRNVQLVFPEQKRNLIYIFLESMETTYASTDEGGAFAYNYIPELTQIAKNEVSFSNADKLGGIYPAYGSGWTMAALFAQTSGLPIKSQDGIDMNVTLAEQTTFSSSAYNIEDILYDAGYNQCFMIGSDAVFGGRKAYFDSHGNCEIWDYNTAIEKGYIPEDYYVWWGYEDEKLFTYAQEKLLELSQQEEPFNLTLLTVDTHFEDGYVCELCQNEFGDDQYANVISCSSRQIAGFIQWIQMQDFYPNTTIVLCGDHLTMDSDFCENLEGYTRGVYNAFINLPEGLDVSYEKTHYRKATTMDMFPTTLAAMGVQIAGDRLGLGTNLFSNEQTLSEQVGYEDLNSALMQKSTFYELLMNDIDYATQQDYE